MIKIDTYYIQHISVQIRHLPSGDIAIWHPFNLFLADIIDSICRNRGRWDRQYNNWIVFSQFKFGVISEIKSKGVQHG